MGERLKVASRGFTLLELIVTLFVLALAIGFTAPVIGKSAEALRARAEVAGFSAMLRHARERAITTGRAHAVVVDPTARRISVTTGDDEVREWRALPDTLGVEASPPPALTVRFEPQGISNGGDFRLTSGSVAYRVTVDSVTGRVRSARE